MKCDEVCEVKGGKQKQDVLVQVETGKVTVTLWEDNVNVLENGSSYNLRGMVFREYNCIRYLSTSIDGSMIEKLGTDVPIQPYEQSDTMSQATTTFSPT